MTLTRIDFPVLARGMDREAPIGTLNPNAAEGPLWREMNNLVPHDGVLRRREAVVEATGGFPTFLDSETQFAVGLFEVGPSPVGIVQSPSPSAERWLLVTSREIYLGVLGAWVNLTPRYETGTVTINNGSSTVTGSGTSWQTFVVIEGQAIELPRGSGSWYKIASVTGETQLTLTSTYAGSNLAGANYSVRRTFNMPFGTPVFAATLNGDLFISGEVSFSSTTFGGAHIRDGGVIQIAGGATHTLPVASIGTTDVTYLTSGTNAVTSGLDNLGYHVRVLGLTVLADGRLVILTRAFPSGAEVGARVHYSSHTNLSVWTSSPGGFTDITEFEGQATAMTGDSRSVQVHFATGVSIGDLTGAQDPPLRFRPSQAEIGAVGPRMIARIPGGRATPPGHFFIAADGLPYVFTGADCSPQSWASSRADVGLKEDLYNGICRHDRFRRYVGFFFFDSLGTRMRELRFYYDTGAYVTCDYSLTVSAIATPLFAGGTHDRSKVAGYVGGARAADSMIYELRDDTYDDDAPVEGFLSDGVFARSDYLADSQRRWAVSHVEIQYEAPVSNQVLRFRILRDGASGFADDQLLSGVAGIQQIATFFPTADSGRFTRLEVGVDPDASASGTEFAVLLSRLVVHFADVGEARTG